MTTFFNSFRLITTATKIIQSLRKFQQLAPPTPTLTPTPTPPPSTALDFDQRTTTEAAEQTTITTTFYRFGFWSKDNHRSSRAKPTNSCLSCCTSTPLRLNHDHTINRHWNSTQSYQNQLARPFNLSPLLFTNTICLCCSLCFAIYKFHTSSNYKGTRLCWTLLCWCLLLLCYLYYNST